MCFSILSRMNEDFICFSIKRILPWRFRIRALLQYELKVAANKIRGFC